MEDVNGGDNSNNRGLVEMEATAVGVWVVLELEVRTMSEVGTIAVGGARRGISNYWRQ